MFSLLLLISLLLGILLVREYLRRRHAFAKDLPVAARIKEILGVDYGMIGLTDEQRFDILSRMFGKYDRFFQIWVGPTIVLGVSHPDLMQKVLAHTDCLQKAFFYDFVGFEHGVFSAKYDLWKGQRKALNPTFNLRILNSFVPIFVTCCQKLVGEMHQVKEGDTIDMFKYTSKCALEMVCGTTLGSDVLNRDGKDAFLKHLEDIFGFISRRMLGIHLYFDAVYKLTPSYRKEMYARKECVVFASKIVQEKKEAFRLTQKTGSTQVSNDSDERYEYKKPQIFIDQLFSMSDNSRAFTDEEILHNVFVMLVAGNDTSGLAVAHASLFLAMYQDIQEKVYPEIIEHFPTENTPVTAESLKLLVYTDMFIKEVLRHCPVAPSIARTNIKDIELDGINIPAGNIFTFNFWVLHRRKDVWGPKAYKFDPDNFLPERCRDRNPNAYMPFSTGARNCLGARYAMISVKVMLIYILRNFRLHTEIKHEDIKYKFGMTLKMSTQHSIQLEKRCKS
ncbi:cytochrome P450 4c21-like isoform X1 [Wyeomyia smithii]|uniref:cytochrome P450 4c21-like isoform X1 n=1 Tax=Wyeomyia smithii TaxID=174621 RepID=UPI002467D15F|nr:cytochrome P450 4c21-like isoform X1 [Wyeomyia smithii]